MNRAVISILGLALAASCSSRMHHPEAPPDPRATPQVVAPPPAPANPFAAEVRDLLVAPCGRCHLPTLGNSNLGALGVFNLAIEPWYLGMTTEQLEGLERRVQASGELDEEAKALVGRFVRCEVEGGC